MSTHSERGHARLSASAGDRWSRCHGSVALIERLPKAQQRQTIYTARGTALHECAEFYFHYGILPPVGYEANIAGFTIRFDEDDVEGLTTYVEYVDSLRAAANFAYGYEMPLDGLRKVHPDLGGSADFWAIADNVLHIVDLKTGRGHTVYPQGNFQLTQYAVGVVTTLPEETLRSVTQVQLTIVQPWASVGEPIKTWATDLSYLVDQINYLKATAEAVNNDPTLTPGDWCRWCPAFAACPALQAGFREIQKAQTLQLQAQPKAGVAAALSSPHALSVADMADILKRWEILEPWALEIKRILLTAAETGVPVPGFKLVPKRGTRKYRDEAMAEHVLVEELGEHEAFTHKLLSPAQAEKALGKKKYRQLLDDLVEMVSSGMNLVLEEDVAKGPDLTPSLPSPQQLGLYQREL